MSLAVGLYVMTRLCRSPSLFSGARVRECPAVHDGRGGRGARGDVGDEKQASRSPGADLVCCLVWSASVMLMSLLLVVCLFVFVSFSFLSLFSVLTMERVRDRRRRRR